MESSTTSATVAIMKTEARTHTPPGATVAEDFSTEQAETQRPDYLGHRDLRENTSDLAFLGALFYVHVFEFAGLEDLAALLTFDEFRILVPADDLHAGVLARLLRITAWRRSGRL